MRGRREGKGEGEGKGREGEGEGREGKGKELSINVLHQTKVKLIFVIYAIDLEMGNLFPRVQLHPGDAVLVGVRIVPGGPRVRPVVHRKRIRGVFLVKERKRERIACQRMGRRGRVCARSLARSLSPCFDPLPQRPACTPARRGSPRRSA